MKMKRLLAGNIAWWLLVAVALPVAGQNVRLSATQGSKVRIEGTANMIHPKWAVESKLVGGSIEAGPTFPVTPGQAVTPGKLDVKADAFIPVRSLKSVEDDGKPYSDAMDDIMYAKMKAQEFQKITFHLTSLTLKEAPKAADAPYVLEATGELTVAGVTNTITMPVNVLPMADGKVKISGSVSVKMTQFKMEPPTALAGALKTGDDVKLFFEWLVKKAPAK